MTKIGVYETITTRPPPPVDGQAVEYQLEVGPAGNRVPFLEYETAGGFITRPGRDLVHAVRNGTGTQITKGQVVYVNGYDSTHDVPTVGLARADALATMPVLGIAAENIAATTGVGRVITQGRITGVTTTGMTVGDRVWVSKATAGAFTNVQPAQPVMEQRLGTVTSVGASGSITVAVQDALEKGMPSGVLGLDSSGNPYSLGTKYKTADQATSGTHTTFVNDTHLQFTIVANGVYNIEGTLYVFAGATTTGAKIAVNGPAIGTGKILFGAQGQITQGAAGAASTYFGNTAVAYDAATTLGASVVGTTAAAPSAIFLHGFIKNGANAGTLALRIAAEVNAVITYMEGSWMSLTRLA